MADTNQPLLREVIDSALITRIISPSLADIPESEIAFQDQQSKADTMPSLGSNTQEIVLLPGNVEITGLGITNDFLDQLCEQAHKEATSYYNDVKLSAFSIMVWPFHADRFTIYLYFYSKFSDKQCNFRFSEKSPRVRHFLPDRFVTSDANRVVFGDSPWRESPQWLEFIQYVYARIGPLSKVHTS
jgi:hypothetical protein